MLDTKHRLFPSSFPSIKRDQLSTLQVNLGYLCNQSCVHCHVNAGPNRTELMSLDTINLVIDVIEANHIELLDLTGGAPELNPHFRYLVSKVRALGVEVLDRCNLTVLLEDGQETLAEFLADEQVQIIASLPCYLEDNVDKQRGKGVFQQSIDGLRQLNALGYANEQNGLSLNLVFNPQGASLPPSQMQLEQDYKKFLWEKYQVRFNALFTITNMPINRFGSYLASKGEFYRYMQVLQDAFILENVSSVMCKHLLSVDWQGYVFDCDFNQQLDMPVQIDGLKKPHLRDIDLTQLYQKDIQVAEHCYGCTAGQGSSCGGALL